MGKERLEQNLIDQMKEAQLKLGFEEETMRLYYRGLLESFTGNKL